MLPSITAAAGGDGKILGALNDKIILLYPFSSAATSFFVAGNTSYSSGPTSASNIVDGLGLKARFAAVTAMTYSDDFKSFVVVDYNTIRLISESDYNVTTVFQETRLINSQYISVYDRVAFVTIVAGNCVLRIDLVNPSSEVWLGVCSQVGVNVLTSAQSRLPLFVLPSISKVTALSSASLLAYAGGWIYVDSSQVRPSSTTLPIDLTGFYGGNRQGPYSVDYYDSACNHVFIDDVRLAVPAIVLRPVIDNASFCSTGQPPLAVLKTDANISLVPYTTSTTQGTTVQVGLIQFTGCDEANASSVTTAPIVNNGGSPTPSPPPPLSPPSTRSPFDSRNNNTPPNGGGGNKNDSGTIVVVIVVSLFGAIVLSLMAAAIYLCVTRKRGLAESDKEVTEREMTAIGVPRPLPTRRQNQDLDLRPLQQLSDPSMTGSTNRNNPGESPTMPSEMHQTADFTALRTTTGGNEQSPLRPQQHDKDVSLETLSQQNNNEMSRELRRHLRRCEYVMNNPYQKGKLLGRGANGSVYAVLLKDGSTIAMKEVNLIGTEDEIRELMKSVDSEAKLLKNLLHENLVTYYGVQCDHKHLTVRLFMENVTGGCLGAMVRSMDERLSEDTARVFTHQILKGLAFIHSHGIMHRDLKCDNILRDSHTGLIKLADFGTAKNVSNATNASRAAQTMIGTPYLMAPEILMAGVGETPDAGYGTKADIWSLGITVAEMLNKGNFPWPAFPSPGHAFLYIASPQGVPIMPDGLSRECQDFIRQCTDRDPKTRPNAEDLLTHEWFNALPEKEDSFSAGFANEHSAAD